MERTCVFPLLFSFADDVATRRIPRTLQRTRSRSVWVAFGWRARPFLHRHRGRATEMRLGAGLDRILRTEGEMNAFVRS